MRAVVVVAVAGAVTGAYAQPFSYFPYTETERSHLAPSWPGDGPLRGTSMGTANPPAVLTYNPCHPNADYDGDGIINRLDDDADGDGIPNHLETHPADGGNRFWTRPSDNPQWTGPIPYWNDYVAAFGTWPGWPASNMVINPGADPDNDGIPNSGWGPSSTDANDGQLGDTDDDGDGVDDQRDLDNFNFYSTTHPGFNWTGLFTGPTYPDDDGDGLSNEWEIANLPEGMHRYYNPSPTATVEDWDGDGIRNSYTRPNPLGGSPIVVGCDPEPLNPDAPAWTNVSGSDWDGDGVPNECDPSPCDPAIGLLPNGDADGDGWPNRCDPMPCDPSFPPQPPPDPDDPCGDGGNPENPENPENPGNPGGGGVLPERPDRPDPHERPDPSPPADVPPDPPPSPGPPEPPEPPDPPGGGGDPDDDECCIAITERLDALIFIGNTHTQQFYRIEQALRRFVGDGDGNTGSFGHLYARLISDEDSFRNRVDTVGWRIADLLDLVRWEMERVVQLMEWEGEGGEVGEPEDPEALARPKEYLTDRHDDVGDAMFERWNDWRPWPTVEDHQDAEDAPVWYWRVPIPSVGGGGSGYDDLEVRVDFAVLEPIRGPAHAVMIIICTVVGMTMVWEEFRRYG